MSTRAKTLSFLGAVIVTAFICGLAGADDSVVDAPEGFGSLNADPVEGLAISLRVASREGRFKQVNELLQQGADPNMTGEFGETALMNAARFDQPAIAGALLYHGAEVDTRDSSDNTALLKSARSCSFRVSSQILARSPNVNWVNSLGETALIAASDDGCLQIIRQLLSVPGVNLNTISNSGKTALDFALENAQTEVGGPYTQIAFLLSRAGAKVHAFQLVDPSTQPVRVIQPSGAAIR